MEEPTGPPARTAPTSAAPDRAAVLEHSLMALSELSRALDLSLDERGLAQLTLLNLMGHFGSPRGVLWLFDESHGRLVPAAAAGVTDGAAAAMAAALDSEAEGLRTQDVVTIGEAPALGHFAPLAGAHGLVALARFETPRARLGWVALGGRHPGGTARADERELLAASMGIVAAAFENQRLVRSLRRGHEELAAANAQLRELDRLRSQLLQNLSHEFRTPVAVILGAASCLHDLPDADARRTELLAMIESQAAIVRDMVAMLLDHAELMSPNASIACEPTDLRSMLHESVRAWTERLQAAPRVIDVKLPDERMRVQADPIRLRRVIDELVTNAVKFSPPGSPLAIHADRRPAPGGWRVELRVCDLGRGMSADELATAFEPFRQGDGTSTRRTGGLGMGLTACHRVVELMGGDMTLDSAPGQGTTVRVGLRAA